MNKEFIHFHLRNILKDAPNWEVEKAIEWVEWYIGTIEKESKDGTNKMD